MAEEITKEEVIKHAEDISTSTPQTIEEIVSGTSFDAPASEPLIEPEVTDIKDEEPEVVTQDPELSPDSVLQELNSLDEDVTKAKLDDAKTPQSIGSFDGLKSRYKGTIEKLRTQVNAFKEKEKQLEEERQSIENLKQHNTVLEELQAKYSVLENENQDLKKEVQETSFYRRKYDAEKDPVLQAKYLSPMEESRSRSLKILEHAGLSDSDWKSLINSSEVEINTKIDQSGIGGLNANSLKNYIDNYQMLKHEYDQVTSPEYIESTLQNARGKALQISDTQANEIFENVKTDFSTHIEELRQSEINKEHNVFVYDKVLDQAQKNYGSLRKALGPEYHNPKVMAAVAQTAFMSASYPYTNQLNKYLLEANAALAKEIREHNAGPQISQTKEVPVENGLDVSSFVDIANTSIEDIAKNAIEDL